MNIKGCNACREPNITHNKPDKDEASDKAVDGKVRENLPREPKLCNAGIVQPRKARCCAGGDVLVHGAHDHHGQGGVGNVVGGDEGWTQNTL